MSKLNETAPGEINDDAAWLIVNGYLTFMETETMTIAELAEARRMYDRETI